MVTRIIFKDKKPSHTLFLGDEKVRFKNGVAEVADDTAKKIKELENPDYTIENKVKESSKDNKKPDTKSDSKDDEGDDTAKKQNSSKNAENKKENGKK